MDRDITSDITTRIIFGPACAVHQLMIDTYPQFNSAGHKTQAYRKQIWNPINGDWDEADMTLPVVDGKRSCSSPGSGPADSPHVRYALLRDKCVVVCAVGAGGEGVGWQG